MEKSEYGRQYIELNKAYESIDNTEIVFYVLIPVYRAEMYIRDCIQSVQTQTYSNFRIIIVYRESGDESVKICKEIADKDNRITLIEQKNKGTLDARQTAINYIADLSKEDRSFVVWLDADDTLKQNALEIIKESIAESDCDMVIYGADYILDGKKVRSQYSSDDVPVIEQDKRFIYKALLFDDCMNANWEKAISTTLVSRVDYTKYYSIQFTEDLLTSIEYYGKCKKAYFLRRNLYNYVLNAESRSHVALQEDSFVIDYTVREAVYDFLEKQNVFTVDDWEEYRSHCITFIINQIITVLSFDNTTSKICSYLDDMLKTEYVTNRIIGKKYKKAIVGRKRIIYELFRHRQYILLVMYGRIRRYF